MDGVGEIHAHTLLHYLGVQYLHFFLVVSHFHLLMVVCPLQLNYEQNDTATCSTHIRIYQQIHSKKREREGEETGEGRKRNGEQKGRRKDRRAQAVQHLSLLSVLPHLHL